MRKQINQTIEQLDETFREESCTGVSCDSTTCDIHYSYEQGYDLWAFHLWYHCGAASPKFNKLYSKLKKIYKTLPKAEEKQRKTLLKHANYLECKCGAIIWEPEWCDGYCSSCGKTNK